MMEELERGGREAWDKERELLTAEIEVCKCSCRAVCISRFVC